MTKTKIYDNGLKLVVEENNSETVSCIINFNTGAVYEKPNEYGYAHFLEHALAGFSTKHHTREQIHEQYAKCGMDIDASTGYFDTQYTILCLPEHFEKCFETMTESLFQNKFDQSEFENEKNVIIQEIGDGELDFDTIMYSVHTNNQFPTCVAGNAVSVQNATIDDLKEFYKREYIPNNLIISVCGNTTLEKVDELITKNILPYINQNPEILRAEFNVEPNIENKLVNMKTEDIQCSVSIIMNGPNNKKEEDAKELYKAVMLCEALNGFDGRLYKTLRFDKGLVYHVEIGLNPELNSIEFNFECKNSDIVPCLMSIKQILKDVSENGITNFEFEKTLAKIKTSNAINHSDNTFRASANLYDMNKYQRIRNKQERLNSYNEISMDDIKELAKKLYEDNCHTIAGQGKKIKNNQLVMFNINPDELIVKTKVSGMFKSIIESIALKKKTRNIETENINKNNLRKMIRIEEAKNSKKIDDELSR